ncbi:MAG TPA: isochorismatase family protein [Acidimicrobiales bacterium]|nr:isochorismatase family protein [Acidimicrobiales bacterium]
MDDDGIAYGPRVALLVVDLQNDFADPRGSLYVRGGEEVVAVANAHVRRARGAGAIVVYTRDWHPSHTPHFAQDGGTWPVHCVAGTWGADFVPDLVVDGPVVHKGTGGEDGYSGFSVRDPETGTTSSTELAQLLSAANVQVVVVCGLTTDYCVKETALDAIRLGYEAIVVSEGVRAVDLHPGDGRRALDAMKRAGVSCR